MSKHLKYCVYSAAMSDINNHPQLVMYDLGITYQTSTPQSVVDQWWFWNCENVPDILPDYLTELKVNPHDVIGCGLSNEQADFIESWERKND